MEQLENKIKDLKTKKFTKKHIAWLVILIILTIGTILVYVFSNSIFGENSIFNQSISDNSTVNAMYQSIPILIQTFQIITIAMVIFYVLKLIFNKIGSKSKRVETITKLTLSFIKYLDAIIALFMVLSCWGVNTSAIIASAGFWVLL